VTSYKNYFINVKEIRNNIFENEIFDDKMPNEEYYNQDVSVAPPHLTDVLLNSQSKEGDHPSVLPRPCHVNIQHLYINDKHEEHIITLGLTEKFRQKYYTTMYYKPM